MPILAHFMDSYCAYAVVYHTRLSRHNFNFFFSKMNDTFNDVISHTIKKTRYYSRLYISHTTSVGCCCIFFFRKLKRLLDPLLPHIPPGLNKHFLKSYRGLTQSIVKPFLLSFAFHNSALYKKTYASPSVTLDFYMQQGGLSIATHGDLRTTETYMGHF